MRFDRFELDEANASFLRDGKAVPLAPTPFAVLCALARQPGSLLTKQALLDEVWGHQFVSESVLKTVISDLRTLLGDDARATAFHRDGIAARLSLHRDHRRRYAAHGSLPGKIAAPQARLISRPSGSALAA